ncbi:MAG: hypothetical protein IPM69_16810 [Ignavibacteria bacterium]|nr:hypothetical protein [Ignavibacteria bacterium]
MKIASYVCLIFLSIVYTLPAQISGSPPISAPSASTPTTDSGSISKSTNFVEATLHKGVSVGIIFGYGFKSGYDFGAGIRAGYSASRLYLGGIFTYHFGRSLTVKTGSLITTTELFGYSVAGEIGYDVLLEKKAILRPFVGVGMSNFKGSSSIVGSIPDSTGSLPVNFSENQNDPNILICPGILVQFPISHDLLFGGDLRYNFVTGDGDYSGFGLYTTFMFRF